MRSPRPGETSTGRLAPLSLRPSSDPYVIGLSYTSSGRCRRIGRSRRLCRLMCRRWRAWSRKTSWSTSASWPSRSLTPLVEFVDDRSTSTPARPERSSLSGPPWNRRRGRGGGSGARLRGRAAGSGLASRGVVPVCALEVPEPAWLPVDVVVPVCALEVPDPAWLPVDVVVPVCALEVPEPAWLPVDVVVPVCALEVPEPAGSGGRGRAAWHSRSRGRLASWLPLCGIGRAAGGVGIWLSSATGSSWWTCCSSGGSTCRRLTSPSGEGVGVGVDVHLVV